MRANLPGAVRTERKTESPLSIQSSKRILYVEWRNLRVAVQAKLAPMVYPGR